jgi:hypothetical protein
MLTAAILLTALNLAVGESGPLGLTNVRTTHGPLGPTRPESKILPGDQVCLCFDIEGFRANAKGKLLYSMGLEVADAKGDLVFKKAPSNLEAPSPAGGKSVPACAKVDVGLETPAGKYQLKVTVADRVAGTNESVTRTYEVSPVEFGLVRLSVTSDREAKNAAAQLSKGRPAWINFTAVGFERDRVKGQPHLTAAMRVLDGNGRSVLPKPTSGTIKQDVPAKVGAVPMQFQLVLAETGRFNVELTVTDEIAGKKTTLSFPIRVETAK